MVHSPGKQAGSGGPAWFPRNPRSFLRFNGESRDILFPTPIRRAWTEAMRGSAQPMGGAGRSGCVIDCRRRPNRRTRSARGNQQDLVKCTISSRVGSVCFRNLAGSRKSLAGAHRFGIVVAFCQAVLLVEPSLPQEKGKRQEMAVFVVLCLIGIWLIMLAWLFFRQNKAT